MAISLTAEDRGFFLAVSEAVFANPFGSRREEIDRRILGTEERLPHAERSALLRERIAARVRAISPPGGLRLDLLGGADRDTLEVALLFLGYQESFADLDAHIDAQLAAGEEPVPLPGARDHLDRLAGWGFSAEEAERYLSIFFQLRRAHRFIDQGLVGRSPSMIELRRELWNATVTAEMRSYARRLYGRMEDFSTLLLGETGTGKERAAAALGRSAFIPFDRRRGRFAESFTRAFISIHLAQFPEALLPSELFGHVKGAFTGAVADHRGILSLCSPYGAIFLDEIGEVSAPVQIRLLRVLQERTFTPVGGHEILRFRGRVIAATNREVADRRREGTFRDDFYYRLTSDVITVPPLRDRLSEAPEELGVLVGELVARILGDADAELAGAVLAAIRRDVPAEYPWPGNVRELEQAVRRILLTRRYRPEGVAARPRAGGEDLAAAIESGSITARELVARYCGELYERSGNLAEVARRTGLDPRTVGRHIRERAGISGAATRARDPRPDGA